MRDCWKCFFFPCPDAFDLCRFAHVWPDRNVCLWDTLVPPANSLVHGEKLQLLCYLLMSVHPSMNLPPLDSLLINPPSAFCCHDSGATVLAMAPKHQLLITGGKKGWISLLDLLHKHQFQSFQAHDSPVKALAVDPTEDCFISGSSEGNIRVCLPASLWVSVPDKCSAEAVKLS